MLEPEVGTCFYLVDPRVDIAHHKTVRDKQHCTEKEHPISGPGSRGAEEDREAERPPSKVDFSKWIRKHFTGSQTPEVRPTELSERTKVCQEFSLKGIRKGMNKSQVLAEFQ